VSGEATRARLLSLLSEACELEHALCCSYLFAAFSIKADIGDGITWRDQQALRRWASQIYHVAAQEMLHLAQAWNILTAVGGSPYYARPNFPQPARKFPLNVALLLRRFDEATMDRFIYYEDPSHDTGEPPVAPASALWPLDEDHEYKSVGELYRECARIIEGIDPTELFVRPHSHQVGQPLIDFYDVVSVIDRRSALRAIHRITLQGEGSSENRDDSHYGVFKDIRDSLSCLPSGFQPARPVGDNPYVRRRRDQHVTDINPTFAASDVTTTLVTDQASVFEMDLFDDVYVSMLQALAHVFAGNSDQHHQKLISQSALELMMTVIKPLGEAITRMPSGQDGVNAGPAFAMSKHAQLPATPATARQVYMERLVELSSRARLLVGEDIPNKKALEQVRSSAINLDRIARSLQ
jgi:hypothetical protein